MTVSRSPANPEFRIPPELTKELLKIMHSFKPDFSLTKFDDFNQQYFEIYAALDGYFGYYGFAVEEANLRAFQIITDWWKYLPLFSPSFPSYPL